MNEAKKDCWKENTNTLEINSYSYWLASETPSVSHYRKLSVSHDIIEPWLNTPSMLVLEPPNRDMRHYTAMKEWRSYILVTCCTLTHRQPWGTPWVGRSDQHRTAWTREWRCSLGFHVHAVPQWSSSPPLHRALPLSLGHDIDHGTHPEEVPLKMKHTRNSQTKY